MAWTQYKIPNGAFVEVWFVDDQNNVPDNMTADLGRVLVRNFPGKDADGRTLMQSFVMDRPPDNWEVVGPLPADLEANPPVQAVADPRADLWLMSEDELKVLGAEMGISQPDGEAWLKRAWVHRIHDRRIAVPNQEKGKPRTDIPVMPTAEPEKVAEAIDDPLVALIGLGADINADEDEPPESELTGTEIAAEAGP